MLGFERRDIIKKLIINDGKVLVVELAKRFDVSEETIRRDLIQLEKEDVLVRTHGGAQLHNKTIELPYNTRHQLNSDKKILIAEKALEFIPEDSTLYIDSSSTGYELIKIMAQSNKSYTVITNSIMALNLPYNFSNLKIMSTGGERREKSHALVGFLAINSIGNYNVDLSIMSCRSIDIENGVMDTNEQDATIKRRMLKQSRKNIMLIDSTKFDSLSMIKVFDLNSMDILITNSKPSEEWIKICQKYNIELAY